MRAALVIGALLVSAASLALSPPSTGPQVHHWIIDYAYGSGFGGRSCWIADDGTVRIAVENGFRFAVLPESQLRQLRHQLDDIFNDRLMRSWPSAPNVMDEAYFRL